MRKIHLSAVAMIFALLAAPTLFAAEPPTKADPPKPQSAPKADDLPGDHIGCAFISKETDFKAHKLSYKLSIGNKLQKPIIAFTGFFIIRDFNGKVLEHVWRDITYEQAPLAPGAVAIYTVDDDAPRKADAAQIAEWQRLSAGLTSVSMTVLNVTFADKTKKVFKTTVGVPKDEER